MSMNSQRKGFPFAQVKGGKWNGEKIYISDEINETNPKIKTFSKLRVDDGHFQLIPNTKKERDTIMICGGAGSGKSYFACQYLKEYVKAYPKNPIYVLSNVNDDSSLAGVPLNYLKIGDNLVNEETVLSYKDFSNCCLYFDDIDSISNKNKWRDAIYDLLDGALECGRHQNITVILIQHVATNGHRSRKLLLESNYFVYFPHGAVRNTIYALESYFGVSKDQVKKIKQLRSRWALISRNFPTAVMTEKNVFLLNSDED